MKIYMSVLVMLILALSAYAQVENTCRLKEPFIITGLQLDTPKSEVQKKFDFTKADKLDSNGDSYKFISPADNIGSMYLFFYKDKLKTIGINYTNESATLPIEEFGKKIASDSGLAGDWKINQERNGQSITQTCGDLIVTISKSGGRYNANFTSAAVINREVADLRENSSQ